MLSLLYLLFYYCTKLIHWLKKRAQNSLFVKSAFDLHKSNKAEADVQIIFT